MALLDRINGTQLAELETQVGHLTEQLAATEQMSELYQERLVELEFALEDQGWQLLSGDSDRELSRQSLRILCRLARLAFIKNPLIKRAVRVKAFYVWAQGVQWSSDDDDVAALIEDLTDDLGNRRALFGHQARWSAEVDLQLDGGLFLACFTNPLDGRVRVRRVPIDEIDDIITNPDDRSQPWFYRRVSKRQDFNLASGVQTVTEEATYHPAMWFEPPPIERPQLIGGKRVRWDAPIYHVKVGGRDDMRFGIPEVYAALDWAKAYREFLEDWATLVRALSRFAFKLTSPGRKMAANKAKLSTTLDGAEGTNSGVDSNPPPPAGSTFLQPQGSNLEAIPKTGATVSAEDGKQLRLMVASAVDLPDTILSGDADQGNLATAKSLDRPTELAFMDRQQLWSDILRDIFTWMVAAAIRAPQGQLTGSVEVEGDNVRVTLAGGESPSFTIDWPPILQPDKKGDMEALVQFATLDGDPPAGTVPPEALAAKGMTILGFENVDDLVADLEAQAERAGVPPEENPEVAAALEQVAEAARALLPT